jgi:hypothetical protein
MSALDKIRLAFPDLKNSSDSELLGEISKLTGTPYESAATMFGVAPRGTAAETARQIGAGFAVDLPRMVGQGLQYTGVAPETGRSLVESAQERAPGWTPDMRGRGLIGEALVTGGRAVGPMAPAIAASFVPGGQFVAPTVAAGLFGTSSAQETYQKLIDQGISEQDAVSAARRVGLVQGPLEGVATAVGLGAFRAAKPLVGLGGTTAGVAARMTDSAVLKPFAKGMAANLAVQPATEVAQDVGTAKIEEAYGGKPEDIAAIARQSALGGVGLTLLLGPLAMGGHVARANRAEKLKEALYSPDTPTEIRAQALDLVMGEARRQNIPEAGVDQWFEQQLAMEDARNAELAKLEAETKAGERDLLVTEEEPLQQRIDQKLGLTRTQDRKDYAKQFEAAFTEGTGQRVADAVTGIEREVTAGELVQRDLPQDLTVAVAEEAKPTVPSIFSELDTELLKQGVKPTKNSRELYQYMVAENIDPASPEAEPVLNALANSKLGEARKAVGEIIRARSPRGAGISTVSQPAGSVGVGSPVVQGGVGAAGSPIALTGGNVQPAGTTGAPVQQAGVLPVAASQPSAPVTPAAPAAPETRFRRAPRPMTVLEAANAAKAAQTQQTETQGQAAPAAAGPIVDPRLATLQQIFGQRNGDIIFDVVGMGMPEPEAATKYGLSRPAIQKIAGATGQKAWPERIARAKAQFGLTDSQIAEAFNVAPQEELGTEVEREVFGRGQDAGAITEAEAIEGGLENIVKTAGAGTAEVEGFTKLQKEIDATLEALATETDEAKLAELNKTLEAQVEKVRAVEKRAQAEVRRTAGKAAEPTTEGEADAVQVESPTGVSVQPEAKAGKGVGGQVRRAKKPAAEGKAKVPAVVLTEAEQAAQAWDVVAADYPTAPKFADLTKDQQETFIEFGPGNWERSDVETELTKLARTAAPTQRVEYPSTAGQQNAPAYLVPAQRAVVDFMNGDITREDLQQKFAELKMTVGQQRSVTNRIEWFPADFEAVKDIIDGKVRLGPDARMSRGAVEISYGNRKFQAAKFSLDEMRANNGIRAAFEHYDSEGMSSLYEDIDIWMIADNSVDFDAAVFPQGNKKVMVLRAGLVLGSDMDLVTQVTHHELGHIADDVFHGGGLSSGRQAFNVSVVNGKIRPMGEVMKEVHDFYNAEPDSEISKLLGYPFDFQTHGALSSNRLREEVYAQLWAIYVNPKLRNDLEDSLPTTFDFMEFEYESAKEAASTAASKTNAAAAQGQRVQADAGDLRASRSAGKRQGLIDRNVAKMPKDLQQPVRNAIGTLTDIAGRGLDYAVFTSDLIGRAEAAGMPAARRFANALAKRNSAANERERRIEKIADMFATIEDRNKGSGAGTVNEFLFESTRTGKWGYDSGSFKADPEMKAMFNALGPKAQAFVKAVFKHGDVMLSEKKKIVMDSATSEYDAMIAAAKVAGDKKAESALLKEKVATLKRFQTLFKIREGLPYAPIKRSGTYAVIGRSDAYNEAVASNNQEQIRKLEQDPKHYQVSFVDSKWEARTLAAEVESSAPGLTVDFVERAEALDDFSGQALLPALTAIRSKVDAQQGTSNTKLLNVISQLYLEALAEDSARKSELRRRGIAGQVDMLSSFTTQGRADANFLASVENNPEVQDALQQMRNQSKTGDRERKSEIFAELSRRYVESLDYKVNPWISKLSGLASKYFLATSPGYYIQNLTQPFMMSVPAMAGKHDYTAAGKALWDAYSELGPIMKSTKLFDQQFDFTQVPDDVKAMVDELVKRGKIDIGLATEINEYKVDADNKLSQFASRLNKGMRLTVQKTEAINRLSTAMAAYRLELKRTGSAEKATEYADRILTETHGDYTAFNAPRIFNSNFGKIALQFRKFQLVQIGFYAKLIRDAFTNPAERAAALRTLGYSLAHTGVFAGALGLPGYAAVAALAGMMFGDDDEPYDLTEEMRKALGPDWANLIMRGAPTLAGVDLSGKVGAGNMLSIAPFMDADLTTQSGVYQAIGTILGGAAGGMTAKMMDGLGLMMGGDFYRGMEQTMPKGIADMLKAGRLTGEGLTRRNGDVLLPEKDVSEVGALFAAIGLPAAQVTSTYQQRQATKKVEDTMQERATQIKNQYAKAYRKQDTASMAEARAAWTKLQEARRRNDMKPQPVSSLLRAPQEQGKREKKIAEQLN